MSQQILTSRPLDLGKTMTVMSTNSPGANSETRVFTIDSESVQLSVFVVSLTGTLTVEAWTLTELGKELKVITFPLITGPTSDLILKKAGSSMSIMKVVATWSGSCEFEVRARGVAAAESSVRIAGAATAKASQADVTTTAAVLIPSSLTDRSGMVVKNNSASGILYLGFTSGEANSADGYPIGPGESIGMDVAAGTSVYSVASAGTLDVRIMEAGA